MNKDDKPKDELHAWSRHYDNLLWTVTGMLAGANGGLLLYAYSQKTPPHWLYYALGISFTMLAVYFSSSFRSARNIVHGQMSEQGRKVARGSGLWLFKQWRVFVVFWLLVLAAWIVLLIQNHLELLEIWIGIGAVCAIIMVLVAYFADYPRKKRTAQQGAPADRPPPGR